MSEEILHFDLPVNQSSYIKVIGVGGGGGNAVNHMYSLGIKGVDFIVCNTDAQALELSPVPTKIQLGKGLGAGNEPTVARGVALEKKEEIKKHLEYNTKMLFITAGMGGGTGTGAAPVIAEIAKEIELEDEVKKILTVAIVTTPFSFEGRKRKTQAIEGIAELRKHVDAILVINNDKLREFGDLPMTKAFSKADDVLTTAAKGISEIITLSSYVQIDFRDVNTVMSNSGVALMGCGIAEGEGRALEAVDQAINSPLLNDNNIDGAKNVLLYISYGDCEVTMEEIDEITGKILSHSGDGADFIWGAGYDSSLGNSLKITLIATGFNEKQLFHESSARVRSLNENLTIRPQISFQGRNENLEDIRLMSEIEEEKKQGLVQNEMAVPVSESFAKQEQESICEADFIAPKLESLAFELPSTIDATVDDWMKTMSVESSDQNQGKQNQENSSTMMDEFSEMEAKWKNEVTNGVDIEEADGFKTSELFNLQAGLSLMGKAEHSSYETENVVIAQDEKKEDISFFMKYLDTDLSEERQQKLRDISAKIKTPEGLMEIEKKPAFIRRNVKLDYMVPSSESEVSRLSLTVEGKITENAFLHDNVD